MSQSYCSRSLAVLALGAVLALAGCAKHGKNHHDHPHTTAAEHVHLPGGQVALLDKESAPALAKVAADMATAANAFLASLDDEQRKAATFPFNSDERVNWHFIPRQRKGVSLKSMKPQQQEAARALLKTGLSADGFVKAEAIRGLETVLQSIEKGSGPVRDPELYFFTIFGKPEPTGTWGWRFEGHHQAFNFTLVEGKAIIGTPNFMGTNPHEVRQGEKKGTRVLGEEEDRGRKLVTDLTDEQKKKAIVATDAPKDIVSGTARQAQIEGNAGLPYAEMNQVQKEQLLSLIELYARRLRGDLADRDLAQIRDAGLDKVHFAWAGSLEKNKGHYYRIQGPTFLVEYDNTQNDANHVHSVWRTLQGKDFGDDLLKEHYDAAKGDKAHGHDAAK